MHRRVKILLMLLLIWNVTAVWAVPPEAGPPSPPRRDPRFTVRASLFSGIPDMFSVSGSLTAFRPIELEAGVNGMVFSKVVRGRGYYARAGLSKKLRDRRTGWGGGSSEYLSLLVGYRRFILNDRVRDYPSHAVSASAGMDVVRWLRPRLGLSAQLTGGLDYWVSAEGKLERFPLTPDLRVALGLAF